MDTVLSVIIAVNVMFFIIFIGGVSFVATKEELIANLISIFDQIEHLVQSDKSNSLLQFCLDFFEFIDVSAEKLPFIFFLLAI